MRDHPAASDLGALATHGSSQFHEGQQVWLNGRQATFIYYASARAATIRYEQEHTTRIVPIDRLAATPPARS
jgi:hypothetical protein